MNRYLLILLFGLMVAPLPARAYDFKKSHQGNVLYYSVLEGDSTVMLVSPVDSGGIWDERAKPSGRLVIPERVQRDGQTYRVVAVDDNAFLECVRLTSVSIPAGVSALGNNAFGQCTSLKTIVFGCDSLGVAYNAFAGCRAIDTIVLSAAVRKMPGFIFSDFKSVGNVIMRCEHPESLQNLFFGCQAEAVLTVGAAVSEIPEFMCYNFLGLKELRFEGRQPSLAAIGQLAFVNCTNLDAIALPPNLKKIEAGAFAHCMPRTLAFSAMTVPVVSGSTFTGLDRGLTVTVPCGSLVAYASSAIGRYFANIVADDNCDGSEEKLKIIYIHDTIVVHDTVWLSESLLQGEAYEEPQELQDADLEEVANEGHKPVLFIDGKVVRIANAKQLRGVGVRVFDEKGRMVVDEQIPENQPVDNYYIRLPKRQRYFLRFDMGSPYVADVERQTVK